MRERSTATHFQKFLLIFIFPSVFPDRLFTVIYCALLTLFTVIFYSIHCYFLYLHLISMCSANEATYLSWMCSIVEIRAQGDDLLPVPSLFNQLFPFKFFKHFNCPTLFSFPYFYFFRRFEYFIW